MIYKNEGEELFSDNQRVETSDNPDSLRCYSTDDQMSALLESWKAPTVALSLDRRVMAAYRRQVSSPLWKRAIFSSIRVPLPAAAAVALLLTTLGLLFFRTTRAAMSRELTNAAQQVQILEVPVVKEKIVTRTVYVGKARGTHAQNRRTSGGYVAAFRNNTRAITHAELESGRYITHTDLSGFQPVTQMKIEIISREKANDN
jgi:hypothetical protein